MTWLNELGIPYDEMQIHKQSNDRGQRTNNRTTTVQGPPESAANKRAGTVSKDTACKEDGGSKSQVLGVRIVASADELATLQANLQEQIRAMLQGEETSLVYLVAPDCADHPYKFGHWTLSVAELQYRYNTYYGDPTVIAVNVPDCKEAEKRLAKAFHIAGLLLYPRVDNNGNYLYPRRELVQRVESTRKVFFTTVREVRGFVAEVCQQT